MVMRSFLLTMVIGLVAVVVSTSLLAGNGKGPGDGTGPICCQCEEPVDLNDDGICDICGGVICDGDGPNGPNGPGDGEDPNGPNGPNGPGDGDGPNGPNGDGDGDGEPDRDRDRNRDGNCE
jgi:hypothetical protein